MLDIYSFVAGVARRQGIQESGRDDQWDRVADIFAAYVWSRVKLRETCCEHPCEIFPLTVLCFRKTVLLTLYAGTDCSTQST